MNDTKKILYENMFHINIAFLGNWDKGENMYQTHVAFAFYINFFPNDTKFCFKLDSLLIDCCIVESRAIQAAAVVIFIC